MRRKTVSKSTTFLQLGHKEKLCLTSLSHIEIDIIETLLFPEKKKTSTGFFSVCLSRH